MRTLLLFLFAASPALAQDFVNRWFDRVGRDVQAARAPFPRSAVQPYSAMGIYGSFDTNLHLQESDPEHESIATLMIASRMEYSDPKVEGAFDLMATWNQYVPDKEFSDDEERIYFRIRYGEPNGTVELAEIFRHESDPLDSQYGDFAERYVSSTFPKATFELAGAFGAEIGAQVGYVMFVEDDFKIQDHWSIRADSGLVAHVTQSVDLVAQGGWMQIQYLEDFDVPDVEGWFARGGVRGEAWKGFLITLLGGITELETDEFTNGVAIDDRVIEGSAHLRWEPTEKLTIYLDGTRQVVFLGIGGDPYEVLTRGVATLELDLTDAFQFRVRGQYDRGESALEREREWIQGSASFSYQDPAKWTLEASAVWRRARTLEPVETEADGWIFTVGILATTN
jgi:hypothetical protein